MRIIGLTGSIACGKTTVSSFLAFRGFEVVDGDRISRELTAPGKPVLVPLRQTFGPGIFNEDGSLNRRRLGQIVFSDPAARAALDNVMAPYLLSAVKQKIENIRVSGAPLCFLDMPLLFEKGYDSLCDAVWTVWLPENLQLSRLMSRDGYSREEAMSRISSVLSSDEKAARSDRVIDNSGTVENTLQTVTGLLNEELSRTAGTNSSRRNRAAPVSQSPENSAFPAAFPEQLRMERPREAKRTSAGRKAAWRMPVWLKISLCSFLALLLIGFTAFSLMNAYLYRCAEKHEQEQKAIDTNYPLVYRELIEKYAAEYNLSPAFVSAIIRNESSFRPGEESGAGARGLMQLMPDTAEWIAHKLGVEGYAFERMYDPEYNIRFGCWYLNYLSRLFAGDPVAVTAAYHAGQGQVKIWLSDPLISEDGYTLPLESMPEGPTKNYAGRVTRDYGIYQEKYFQPDLPSDDSGTAASTGRSQRDTDRGQYCDCGSVLKNASDQAF